MRIDYWIVTITAGIDIWLWSLIIRGIVGFQLDPQTRQFKILREVKKMERAARERKFLDALPLHERWGRNASRERNKKGK